MSQYMTTAMEILVTATTTISNTFNNPKKTIADQFSKITTLTNKLLAATEAAVKLNNELATIKISNGHSGQGSGG